MSYQVNAETPTCDACGKQMPWDKANVSLVTPDSAHTSEDYLVLCLACAVKGMTQPPRPADPNPRTNP